MIPVTYIAKKVAGKETAENGAKSHPGKLADIQRTAAWVGLGALGLGITFIMAKRAIKNIRRKNSERKFTNEAQQAILLRSAINPSGISWMMWMDGTKEQAIYDVAGRITNFRKVQQEYQNLFNSSLVNDLEKELSTDEYNKFMNIVNTTGSQGVVAENNTSDNALSPTGTDDGDVKNKVILIKNPTKIYEKFTWYPLGSVKSVKPYTFINHLATGNIKRLTLGWTILEFVETRIKTVEGSVKTVYVNRADVTLVSQDDFLANYRDKYTKITFNDSDF